MERTVYLPVGSSWTDAHSGRVYEGGNTLTYTASLDVIPVFLRNNALEYLINKI